MSKFTELLKENGWVFRQVSNEEWQWFLLNEDGHVIAKEGDSVWNHLKTVYVYSEEYEEPLVLYKGGTVIMHSNRVKEIDRQLEEFKDNDIIHFVVSSLMTGNLVVISNMFLTLSELDINIGGSRGYVYSSLHYHKLCEDLISMPRTVFNFSMFTRNGNIRETVKQANDKFWEEK